MLYNIKANVFPVKLGSEFGRTVSTTIVVNDKEDPFEQAKISFNKYINALYKHHNIDGDGQTRKIINTFNYNNLKLV